MVKTVKPETLDALLQVARKHGAKRLSVPLYDDVEARDLGVLVVDLESIPVMPAAFAATAPAESEAEQDDALFDAVEA